MDPGENNDLGARFGGLLREAKRIAYVVSHVLDLWDLVIVGEDDRVELFLQRENLPRKRVELRRRHRLAHFQPVRVAPWDFDHIGHRHSVIWRGGESISVTSNQY